MSIGQSSMKYIGVLNHHDGTDFYKLFSQDQCLYNVWRGLPKSRPCAPILINSVRFPGGQE